MNHVFQQDEQGVAVEKIMDENVPGWRDRQTDFETFDAFSNWISDCLRGILTQEPERQDH